MRKSIIVRCKVFFLLALAVGMTGCVDLKPRPDATRFFVLGSSPGVTATTPTAGAISLGIESFSIAPYLDSPRIAVRVEEVEITYSANSRWGEQLDRAIQRRLVDELAGSSSIGAVHGLPWPDNSHPSRRLAISVDHFEGRSDSTVSVSLSWTVSDAGGAVLDRGTANEQLPSWMPGDYRDLVVKLNQALTRASAMVVTSVESTL
jgi:uncharacterized lipoprotein YmbA